MAQLAHAPPRRNDFVHLQRKCLILCMPWAFLRHLLQFNFCMFLLVIFGRTQKIRENIFVAAAGLFHFFKHSSLTL